MPATPTRSDSKTETRSRRISETMGLALLLLLIPSPISTPGSQLPDNIGYCFQNHGKPSFLHYAASLLTDSADLSTAAVIHSDEEEDEVTGEKLSSSGSSNGESYEVLSQSSIDSGLPVILGYVPLAELEQLKSDKVKLASVLRATTRPTTPTSERRATRSTASLATPGYAVFIKTPNFDSEEVKVTPRPMLTEAQIKELTQWKCPSCAYRNPQGQQHCMSVHCLAPCPENQKHVRAFFGQLRKEHTVEFVQWITSTLCPNAELLHIENHTNSKSGRGKGCAWVYADKRESLDELLTLHKRVFLDVVDGEEGIWVVPENDEEARRILAEYVSVQERDMEQSKTLPRQALVVELPAERTMTTSRREPKIHTNSAGPYSSYATNSYAGDYTSAYPPSAHDSYYYSSQVSSHHHSYNGYSCQCAQCASSSSYYNNYYNYPTQQQYSEYPSYSHQGCYSEYGHTYGSQCTCPNCVPSRQNTYRQHNPYATTAPCQCGCNTPQMA